MEAPVETFIKDFVWARTGEKVYVDLSTPSVVLIRDVTAYGSTALAALWLNILQHPNNYPVQHYPYRKLYQKNGTYNVVLSVDDVTLTVSMTLGSLRMKGEFILHWFQTQFLKVLDSSEKSFSSPQLLDDKYSQLTKTWKNIKIKKQQTVLVPNEKPLDNTEDEVLMKDDSKIEGSKKEETAEKGENTCIQNTNIEEKYADIKELKEALQVVNTKTVCDDSIERQIACLIDGCVQDGPEYIYLLWKSLLDQWFMDASNRVYIVTPRLDVTRLKDICELVLKHRLTANLEAVYVHQKCDLIQNIGDVKRSVQTQYPSKDQVFIEYKIYSNIIYPLAQFQCRFIACICQGKVNVLQTSADFHSDHFDKSSVDTVSFHQMSKDEFHQRFLKPILASQVLKVSEN